MCAPVVPCRAVEHSRSEHCSDDEFLTVSLRTSIMDTGAEATAFPQRACSTQNAPLLALDNDTLGLVLRAVNGKDRMAVMLTCQRLCAVALSRAWPPWSRSCRGLVFAVRHGHVAYFQRHARIAGDRLNLRPWSRGLCSRALASRNTAMLEALLDDPRVDATQGTDTLFEELAKVQAPKKRERFASMLAAHGVARHNLDFAAEACSYMRLPATIRSFLECRPPELWMACMEMCSSEQKVIVR